MDPFFLNQTAYIAEVLETFRMANTKCAATPLDKNLKFSGSEDVQSRKKAKKNKHIFPTGKLFEAFSIWFVAPVQ